jgi:DNA (cytosine-5)-methyltransferase 1
MVAIQRAIQPSDITCTDMFCGLGGNSEGADQHDGVQVELALNHWVTACTSYGTNHQKTKIECADVSNTDPRRYWRTNILIASPECTKHSPAGGRRRKNPMQADLFKEKKIDLGVIKSRATMNDVVAFTEVFRYDIVVIENVVEVMLWELFDIWLMSMHRLGYDHQIIFLNAMFVHGQGLRNYAPQSRDRIYIVFHKKGNPKPNLDYRPVAPCNHCGKEAVGARQAFKPGGSKLAKYETQYIYVCPDCGHRVHPYFYSALNAIDLSIPIKRIRERIGGAKEPFLSANTLARCEYGLRKYGWRPLTIDCRNSSGGAGARTRVLGEEVLNAQSTGFSTYLFAPPTDGIIVDSSHSHAGHGGKVKHAASSAMPTGTTQMSSSLLLPENLLLPEILLQANREHSAMRDATVDPLFAENTGNSQHITLPAGMALGVHHGTSKAQDIRAGLNAQTVVNKSSVLITPELKAYLTELNAFTSPYHGANHQARSGWEALTAITTKAGMQYVEGRGAVNVEDCFWRMLQTSETKRGQGFRRDYFVSGSKADQQKQIGNANPPNTMEWIIGQCKASLC